MSDPSDPSSYTVGWVCALSTEFTAAQEQFDEEYEPHESPEHREANDSNVYSFGKIKGHMVVVAVMPNGQYGTASAATVAKDMIRSFRNIRFGLMVGIGGGAPTKQHDIRLGDVVVSSPTPGQSGVFQYDFGKATKEGFQHTASHNKPPPLLLAAVAGLKTQHERKGLQIHEKVSTIVTNNKRLRAKYGRPDDPDSLFSPSVDHKSAPCHEFCVTASTDLKDRTLRQEPLEVVEVHYGTIASGDTLMTNAFKRDELASEANILCFEMEAAGLIDVFRCLIVRGICDYCDSHKNDKWQGYAAMTAAVYAKQILGRIRPEAVAREETMISKIDEVISGVKHLKRSIAEQEVLEWLSDEDFGAYQFDERSKKAPGTCQWFFNSPEYQSWTQNKSQVLFCPGIAGAGKSVLASAVIENLHARFQPNSSTAIVHIYCRYNRVDQQTFDELWASILRQLCERLSPLPECITQVYNQYKPQRVKPPRERSLSVLKSVSSLFSKVFLVVDALDEWRAEDHAGLYSLPGELLFLHRKLSINLLATSRPLPLITNHFSNYPSLSIIAQQEDIDAYVDNFGWPESSCIGKIPGLRNMVKEIMSRLVKGMFLLARLYLHSLEHETSERDVKDALERLKDRAKHNTNPKFNIVDQAYSDTLKRLREQNQKHCDLAFRVITWICCTGWSLPVDAVQHGLALREGDTMFHEDGMVDQQLMLSVCWGLVEISKGSGELRLVHYTTKDFFRHNLHMLDEYFLTRHSLNCHLPSSTDAYLARQCLTCLSIGLPRQHSGGIGKDSQPRFRSCDAFKPSRLARLHLGRGSSLEQHDYETLVDEIKRDPLYEYSAFNFVGHLKRLPRFDQTYINSIALLRRRGMFDQAVLVVLTLGDRKRGKIQVPKELSPCHLAALFGLIDLAKSQMERPNLDAIDDHGPADLVWAMECWAFKFLFISKINMRSYSSELYLDIDSDRRRIVKALIASGANPHMLGYEGNTPLHLAAISGDWDIVQMLLDRGADIRTSNENGHIPLVLAIRNQRRTAYMKLLELGTVDMCGENRRTALVEAASVGDLTLVETLIQQGATVDSSDDTGQTALMEASKRGDPQIVKLLLEKKADVNRKDHNCDTTIIKACIGGDPSVIELLLEANAQLEFTNAARETVLSNVGRSCGESIIKRLLRHSTDPATRDRHSGYVLASASKDGRLDIVSSILEDAAFKPALEYLNLALSKSCSAGNDKVVKLLIDHGANPNTNLELIESPETLLTRAIREGDDAIVLLLLDAGINCENENKARRGPIHAAASTGTKLMVQSLIDKGFSVNHRASIGLMPLDFAMRREDKDTSIADFLRERGAITEVERLVRFMRNRRKKVD
ncbi:related to ankyrin [Fusarium fujikuroi IMI 58289]|uniref:Related to ankyrin n=1 Tax=Gibberella fujikuroi (strain CBS 195.34 / IMI 58289 / NRRL A-6831) TaxID=1279085 RepID=S0DS28_GIBF5|nr:related to ankyrin [Fusarium fujikuroi IMI 58289]CCT65374.1 related to ankyrin [Fusarium fujikuroi IMI 58289]SCO24243.1 related to ankyrin [Fusarium fujikuroi]